MKVLSNKELEHIITWMPTGKSFSIIDPKAFVATVLPEEFKSAKYASFTRKLHRWGFLRHYRGEEAGAFYHEHFQRDSPDLVEKMTCYKTSGTPATGTQTNTPQVVVRKQLSKQQRDTKGTSTEMQPTPPPQQQILGSSSAAASKPAARNQNQVSRPIPQLQQQQQQQQQQQINLSGFSGQQMGMAERLNAAIELEVARRLQERIQAAALSRHNLALFNHHQFDQRPTPMNMPWNSMNGNLQAQLLYKLQQQKQQQQLVNPQVASQMENKGLEKLPDTNIQGAKTA